MKNKTLEKYFLHLKDTRKVSENTLQAYMHDCICFDAFLKDNSRTISNAQKGDALDFIAKMQKDGKSSSTVTRCVSSLKSFYSYLVSNSVVRENPFDAIKLPKNKKCQIAFLTPDEIDSLISSADCETNLGIRDRAMLEVIYATGMKVTELISLRVCDVDTDLGYVRLCRCSNIRIVPLGKTSVESLIKYLSLSRPAIAKENCDFLFVNSSGSPMTRQGFWKILKGYAKKSGIEKEISPASIRHSFAVHLLHNGADIISVAQMLGHKDISSVQGYVKLLNKGIRDVYNKSHPRA